MGLRKVFLVACLLGAGFNSQAQTATKVIKFGVEPKYAPFEFKNAKGEIEGFDIDISNAICAKLKAKCEYVESSFDSLIPALLAGKFDVINSALNITPTRQKVMNFSHPLYAIPTQLIAKKGSLLLPTAESLKGKRVGVLLSSQQESFARKNWSKTAGVTVVSYSDQVLNYAALAAGDIDASLTENPQAFAAFLTKPIGQEFAFVGDIIRSPDLPSDIGLAFNKNDGALKIKIDKVISELIVDGTIKKLSMKYFKPTEITIPES